MATGLRVGDVLALKTADVQHGPRMTVREQKTGKSRRVYWPAELRLRMLQQAGRVWVFEGRNDWRKHRTRSAVYKDLQRAARVFRASGVVPKGAQVSTHTGRKIYAVDEFRRTGSVGKVAALLNHDEGHSEVTLLYALADELTRRLRALGLTVEEVEVLLSNGFTERDLDDMAIDREYLEECRAMCF